MNPEDEESIEERLAKVANRLESATNRLQNFIDILWDDLGIPEDQRKISPPDPNEPGGESA